MNCPLCRRNSSAQFQAHGFSVRECSSCRHRFAEIAADEAHTQSVYGDEYFTGGGVGYSDYLAEKDLLIARGRNYARLVANYRQTKGEMLDVGAACGFLLRGFAEEGWRGKGIEPNVQMARKAFEMFGLDVWNGTLETFQTTQKFDLITMIQVAAHFYDAAKSFENAVQMLDGKGFLLIETWNRESLTARIFGKNWHEYSPPSVLHWFSPDGLTNFLADFGLEKIAQGRPSKWISGAHAKSLLAHKIGASPFRYGLRLIPEKLNFPYPAEDLFWLLLSK